MTLLLFVFQAMASSRTTMMMMMMIMRMMIVTLMTMASASVSVSPTMTTSTSLPYYKYNYSYSYHDIQQQQQQQQPLKAFDSTPSSLAEERQLAIGDFDRFNTLFQNTQLRLLPNGTTVSDNGLTLTIQNLICHTITIGDIQTNYTINTNTNSGQDQLVYTISAYPITSITCTADYTFNFLFFNGKGTITATALDTLVETQLYIQSDTGSTFNDGPPTSTTINYCNTDINTNGNIVFEGATLQRVLNLLKQLISNIIDREASSAICTLVNDALPNTLNTFIQQTNTRINTWSSYSTNTTLSDPLYIETTTPPPNDDIILIPFLPYDDGIDNNTNNTSTTSVSELFVRFLSQADTLLGNNNNTIDPITNEPDLGINIFLRKSILDENGIWDVNISQFNNDNNDGSNTGGFNPIILDSHDILTQSSMVINTIQIHGLDTIQKFTPFNILGNYTISNQIQFNTLSLQMGLTITIKPSSLPDSILYNPDPNIEIVENITIDIDISNIIMNISLFIPINEDKFHNILLGSLLSTENIVPCFVSSMESFQISGLYVTIADISTPILNGFVAPGIDRLLSQLSEAITTIYKPTLLRSIPGIFQGPFRTLLQTRLLDSILHVGDTSKCPIISVNHEDDDNSNGNNNNNEPVLLDFRDLFLLPNDAQNMGATGIEQPYGNLGFIAYNFIQEQMMEIHDITGKPKVNKLLIDPFTISQSGTAGVIQFPQTFFEFGGTMDTTSSSTTTTTNRFLAAANVTSPSSNNSDSDSSSGIQLSIGDIRIRNINSITTPFEFLNVTNSSTILTNTITTGSGNDSNDTLTMTIKIIAGVQDRINEIDLSIGIESFSIMADINAMVDANHFLQFPLGDILNYHCWLSILLPVTLDSNGYASGSRSLSLVEFTTSIASLNISTECITCVSPGIDILPEIFQIMIDTNAIGTLSERLPSFINSLALSSSTQTFLDRMIADAPQFCPNHPNYNVNATKTVYNTGVGFPILSSESIDTLLYTGIIAAEVAFVVFAETQRLSDIPLTDPLSLQESFITPNGIRLIDWTDIGNSTGLGPTADKVFNEIRNYLNGGSTEDSSFDVDKILGSFLSKNGTLQLDTDLELENGGISISIDSIQIRGLDNFSLVDILEPIGAQTLSISAEFDTLEVDLIISAKVPTSSEPPQTIAVNVSTQNVSVAVALFVAVDLDKLGALELGSLFETKSIIQCLLSTTHKFEIPQMKVTIESFNNPTISGLRSDTGAAATLATETLFNRFKADILEAIPKIFDGVAKDLLSNFLDSADEASCEAVIREPLEGAIVDFRDLLLPRNDSLLLGGSGDGQYGNLVSSIFQLIKDEMFTTDSVTGLASINSKLIDDITETQSGTPGRLYFPGDLINSDSRVQAGGLDARVRLRAYGAYINNLNTIGTPLEILEPMNDEPNLLNNTAKIGVNVPVQLGFRLLVGISNDESDIDNDLEINLDLNSFQVLLVALIKISEKALTSFPIKDITNLQCWLATIPAPVLDSRGVRVNEFDKSLTISEFVAFVKDISLNISCVECSGPRMYELTELLSGVQGSQAVTDIANEIFSLVPALIEGNFFQLATDRALNDARMKCPHSPTYDPEFTVGEYDTFNIQESKSSVSFFLALVIVCAVLAALVLAFVLTTKFCVRRRHSRWIKNLDQRQLLVLLRDQQQQDTTNAYICESTKSMFNSYEVIPFWVRWLTPVLILGNIGFFLSGHLSLAASVTIIASLGGQSFSEEGFFEFSVAKSTIEIWNAGGEELAILIFIFSFIWPYTKTLITMVLWFVSPSTLSVERRGSVLLWLDFLAKWSTIDIFVLIVTIVSFRVSVQSPDIDFLPEDFYSLDLMVSPKWGLYANLIAQIISQLSSHYIIHYHRRIVEEAIREEGQVYPDVVQTNTALIDEDGNEIEANVMKSMEPYSNDIDHIQIPDPLDESKNQLYSHAYVRPHRGESDKLVIRRMVSPLLVLLTICCIVLIILGCILPSYSVSALGIVGVLVESGQQFAAATNSYSVITTMTLLFDQAKLTGSAADFIGLGSLSIILIFSVLVAPVIQSLVLLVQWFAPLTRKRRHRLMIMLEVLQAWQYAEVYLLAIIVGSWQLGPISEFMINPYCSSLKSFFAEMVYYGILKDEDAQCFRTDVVIAPTFYLLFIAAILLNLINAFIMKAISQYIRDKGAIAAITTISQEQNVQNANSTKMDDMNNDFSIMNDTNDFDTISDDVISKIHPVPVLFSDRYRWFLKREDESSCVESSPSSPSSSSSLSLAPHRQQSSMIDNDDDDDHNNHNNDYNYSNYINTIQHHGSNNNNNTTQNSDIHTIEEASQEPVSFVESEWETFGPPSHVDVQYNFHNSNIRSDEQSIDDVSLFTNTLDPPE